MHTSATYMIYTIILYCNTEIPHTHILEAVQVVHKALTTLPELHVQDHTDKDDDDDDKKNSHYHSDHHNNNDRS